MVASAAYLRVLAVAFLLVSMLSCWSSAVVIDMESVGHQHFENLFQGMLERKAEMDGLRAIQCPCVAESGIDVDRYTVDFKGSYSREEYERTRALLVDLQHDINGYDRSMTEARCHWTVSSEKFKAPDDPIECPADR